MDVPPFGTPPHSSSQASAMVLVEPYSPNSPEILAPYSPGSPIVQAHISPGSPIILAPDSPGSSVISAPESPGSPVISAPDSPGSPSPLEPNSPAYPPAWRDQLDDNGNPLPIPASPAHENSNDSASSTVTYEPNPVGHIDLQDDNSDSLRPLSSQSDLVPVSYVTELTNSLMSLEDAHLQKDDESSEPPAKVRKLSSPKANDDTDGETCPICLDTWGNSGEHRLVALKCGHLFGAQCVERWLKAQSSRERSCPTCKSKATLKDIRFIYAKRLVAADSSQITTLQKQVDLLQTEKSRAELELQKCKIAHRACVLQLEVLRSTLLKSHVANEQPIRQSWRFALDKNLEICKDGGCRVLTYNCRTYELYVTQKSLSYLFPGYGIQKVSLVDYKLGQFLHLHPKPIRDITYSQPRDLLMSVSLDSTARIVERGIPSAIIRCGMPLWSCSWDYLRSNEFYVGGVGGVIHQYDVRNPNTYIQRLTVPGDMSPVVSLCSTEFGLLSCQLNSCWLWVANMRQWEPRALPVEGPFMSMCYDNESHRALVSCRAGANGSDRARLTLCKLKASVPSGEVLIQPDQSFTGSSRSTLMSRATVVRAPGSSWVAAHSESDSSLFLHGLDGSKTLSLPAAEPALDVCSVHLNSDTIVAALSASRLRLYKAVMTNSRY